ncbi:S-adenosyl-L-methionine-dependent methyltransferase [Lojkania enalia]|uniref:S-adenosyl-L-methionine-dependent methyltransferase n=1 Tax=Lojkania enalia TaxID=147567 RepID=A0A9P4KDC4_9PLEO|nr:S-adenosyl-L-methionine-dependent methyltransferase [Didymosphaeria enalia]
MSHSRLLELSAIISESTKALHDHLAKNDLPVPAFANGTTSVLANELSAVQDALVDATNELQDLLLPPRNFLFRLGAHNNLIPLQAIVRYDVPGKVPLQGDGITYAELASATGLSEQLLRRFLRYAITMRVFAETKGKVVHTAASRALIDPHLRGWLKTGSNEMWPAASRVVDAVTKWPGSQEPNETVGFLFHTAQYGGADFELQQGFTLASGNSQSIYNVFETDPSRAADFASTMHAFSTTPEMSLDHLTSYDLWKTCKSVVDVGGSTGKAALALATVHPHLHVTVQDLPTVIAGVGQDIAPELSSRVSFMSHDFLAENAAQPVKNADVYLLRWILHNWSDKYSIRILQSLRPALKKGARVLIMEVIMPEPGALPLWKEKDLRTMDMDMLTLFNSEERGLIEWQKLIHAADPHFRFVKATEPVGSALGIIEIEWDSI